jgi:hypothetical protein
VDEQHRRGRSIAGWEIPIYHVVNDRLDRVDGQNKRQEIRGRLRHLRHPVPLDLLSFGRQTGDVEPLSRAASMYRPCKNDPRRNHCCAFGRPT